MSPARGKPRRAPEGLRRAAVGLEAELSLFVNDTAAKPELVFGDPRARSSGVRCATG